ncbi:MAG: SGNH/GDSL hydrolase family protein [Candidatus Aegiribacteria sp.]|nr:SGNH/GDSL hydrolase family protein [Candidatus Aegiribacteria sp.]
MAKAELTKRTVTFLKNVSIICGSLLVVIALVSNLLGFSISEGFSWNQLVIVLIGIVLILGGIAGRRFPVFYKGFALLLLNTAVVLILLDLASLFIVKLWNPEHIQILELKMEAGLQSPIAEERMSWGRYEPYVVWRADTSLYFEDEIDPDGFRITPVSNSDSNAYKVFVFGGSTVWGTGVPDSSTIPSYLCELLQSSVSGPVEVRNFGQLGYVSTQEMIELCFQLRSDNVPDLVLFLDGMNDVAAAYESGIPGTHQNYPLVRARVESRLEDLGLESTFPHPLLQLFHRSNFSTLLSLANSGRGNDGNQSEVVNYLTLGADTDSLSFNVARIMFANYDFIEHLSEQYVFDVLFFIQPSVWTGSKALTEEEISFALGESRFFAVGADSAWKPILIKSYDWFETISNGESDVKSLTAIFDDVDFQIYTDFTGVHLTAEGNMLVAQEMYDVLISRSILPVIPDSI